MDPYCSLYGGMVLNVTIGVYVYATVTGCQKASNVLSRDQGLEEPTQTVFNPKTTKLPLHQATFEFFRKNYENLELDSISLETYTDAPVGSGLGTSSTLVVSCIEAISRFFGLEMSKYDVAKAAQVVERQICCFAGGRQDSYSSVFGGWNFMSFSKEQNLITPIRLLGSMEKRIESELMLVNLGASRVSSKIIQEQQDGIFESGGNRIEAMHKIKGEASAMLEKLVGNDYAGFVNSFNDGWLNKKRTSKAVSNEQIDNLMSGAFQAGAVGGKVSGAGGGGFMTLLVPTEKRRATGDFLRNEGMPFQSIKFDSEGVVSWVQ